MGHCRFCCKPAGFFRNVHGECRTRHNNAVEEIITLIEKYSMNGGNLPLLKKSILRNAQKGLLRSKELSTLVAYSWEKEVEKSFEKGLLTEHKEKYLTDLMKFLSTSRTQLSKYDAYDKIVKGSLLRNVSEGVIPEKTNHNGILPFNLQKSEKLIWLFQGTDYYEQKRRVRYAGNTRCKCSCSEGGLSSRKFTQR